MLPRLAETHDFTQKVQKRHGRVIKTSHTPDMHIESKSRSAAIHLATTTHLLSLRQPCLARTFDRHVEVVALLSEHQARFLHFEDLLDRGDRSHWEADGSFAGHWTGVQDGLEPIGDLGGRRQEVDLAQGQARAL